MDIGPVRRRLTVEPVVSPVAGDPVPPREPAASERGAVAAPEAPGSREHETVSPTRA